ncbi:MAG: DUF494 family protein [Legionella sp.]|nr:MAG: DUF494 family protein [Legionella sp.]
MKDNLFEMLLDLFEQSLSQLQKGQNTAEKDDQIDADQIPTDEPSLYLRPAAFTSMRVLTYDEQMKLTKASYQFLMRMKQWCILDTEVFELIMNQLQQSDSRIVTLEETKWTIRNILAPNLTEEQLSFLDLVLYQTEDAYTIH